MDPEGATRSPKYPLTVLADLKSYLVVDSNTLVLVSTNITLYLSCKFCIGCTNYDKASKMSWKKLAKDLKPKMSSNPGLFTYLGNLNSEILDELYTCPWTCLSVLRSLPTLSKQLLLRILNLKQVASLTELQERWVKASSRTKARLALKALEKLAIISIEQQSETKAIRLHTSFKGQIRSLLSKSSKLKVPLADDTAAQLTNAAFERMEAVAIDNWNLLLHFIVGSKAKRKPDHLIVLLLVKMGLMKYTHAKARPGDIPIITNKGYEFMLLDMAEQIWLFMKYYVQQASRPVDVLHLIFRLQYCNPGLPCNISNLTEGQHKLLRDFSKFGLISINSENQSIFYPTSLGVNIVYQRRSTTSKTKPDETMNHKPISMTNREPQAQIHIKNSLGMAIISETNFKCYAYTESPLHVEMLKLFLSVECILPNLVVGVVTRKSINSAFKKGIDSKQIIHFLEQNAHPLCRHRHKLLPDNVTDQIILWERERNRMNLLDGVLYYKFDSTQQFRELVDFAVAKGFHVWSNKSKQMLFIPEAHHEAVRDYILKLKEKVS